MNMKKLVSLGVISAMVASVSPNAFASSRSAGSINDVKAFVIEDNTVLSTVNVNATTLSNIDCNGFTVENAILIEKPGNNAVTKDIIFGLSNTCLFGRADSSYRHEILEGATNTTVKVTKYPGFSQAGNLTLKALNAAHVNTSNGTYKKAYGVKAELKAAATKDRFAAFTVQLKDWQNNTKDFNVVLKAVALDKDDTSDSEVDADDNGLKPFADDTPLDNGYTINAKTLKYMVGKGNYHFTGAKGIDVVASVSQATANDGNTSYNATLSVDSDLSARYDKDSTGKIMKLSVPFLSKEKRQINIDCGNQNVINILGSDFCDKIENGNIKRLYVYPIHQEGLESLAKASGNDGLINTDEVIIATVKESKIVLSLQKDITDVMISSKEIDTTKLPAIPGVSIPESTSAANEVVAPVVTEDLTSESSTNAPSVISPSVVSAPVLDKAPIATNGTQQDTGASDVVVLAIALAAISMIGAGVVASKKF